MTLFTQCYVNCACIIVCMIFEVLFTQYCVNCTHISSLLLYYYLAFQGGEDYFNQANFTLELDDYSTNAYIQIELIDDSVVESSETFTGRISVSQSDVLLLGTERDREFNVTILEDDCEFSVVQFAISHQETAMHK